MEAIRTEALSKTYLKGLRQRKVLALNNLSLTVADGEIFGFLGPNGAGKSTTIKLLCDLIRPTSGRAAILGQDVGRPEARRQIGYLPENPTFYAFLTGWELLEFHGTLHGMHQSLIQEHGKRLLDMLELADAAHRPLRTYSKGMVQRLGIAAALIHDPQVLIFDEPTRGIDVGARHEIYLQINALAAQGKAIVMVSSDLPEVIGMADRILVMHNGTITGEINNHPPTTQEEVMQLAIA